MHTSTADQHISAHLYSHSTAPGVPLADGETITDAEFFAHVQRTQQSTDTSGPVVAALWLLQQTAATPALDS